MVLATYKQQLRGFGLTTANILYRMPDHPGVLQMFVGRSTTCAAVSRAPPLPRILERELDGPLHSVTVAHQRLVSERELRAVSAEFRLH